jgi:hypothetical protein
MISIVMRCSRFGSHFGLATGSLYKTQLTS